jgi:hypothetical protein
VAFRFRRTFSLVPGVRLNVGATGASLSVGPKGAKLTVGSKGVRATAGVPGTGMFISEQFSGSKASTEEPATSVSPEIEAIISDRPPHWESKLIQAALRSGADDLNSMFHTAMAQGIDAPTFNYWIGGFLSAYHEIIGEWKSIIENELAVASGRHGAEGNPELILKAVAHLAELTEEAIILQQRATALAHHPVFGFLAVPFRDSAAPFVEAYNDLLAQFDTQLPQIDVTHKMSLNLTLKPAPALTAEFENALARYGEKFVDSENHCARGGDVIRERFFIARGKETVGEFSRTAITENLASGVFRSDDLYWSEDLQQWQLLSGLP